MNQVANLRQTYECIRNRFKDAPEKFEFTIRDIYTFVLKEGGVAFDIGAHTGKHTLPMSVSVAERGSVYAFEPICEKFIVLQNKIVQGGILNCHLFNCCCSDVNSIVDFTYLPETPGKSSLNIRNNLKQSGATSIVSKVMTVKLDDFLVNKAPNFIKIDVEGAEYSVLLGSSNIITCARPIIHTELGADTLGPFGVLPESLYDFAKNHSYSVYDILGNSLRNRLDFIDSVNAPFVYDYIWIPDESTERDHIVSLLLNSWAT